MLGLVAGVVLAPGAARDGEVERVGGLPVPQVCRQRVAWDAASGSPAVMFTKLDPPCTAHH